MTRLPFLWLQSLNPCASHRDAEVQLPGHTPSMSWIPLHSILNLGGMLIFMYPCFSKVSMCPFAGWINNASGYILLSPLPWFYSLPDPVFPGATGLKGYRATGYALSGGSCHKFSFSVTIQLESPLKPSSRGQKLTFGAEAWSSVELAHYSLASVRSYGTTGALTGCPDPVPHIEYLARG